MAAEPLPVATAGCASRKPAQKYFAPGLRSVAHRNRHSYENRTRFVPALPPAAIRDIVPHHRHAAGALTPLELSLGRPQPLSSVCGISDLEARLGTPGPGLPRVF